MCPHEFELNITKLYRKLECWPHQASSIMPTSMEQQLKLSNEHVSEWYPEVNIVDGCQYIKLDCKDRSCFKFLTGKYITFGSKYENTKYILQFWQDLVKARSEASQAAFECMQQELHDAQPEDRKRRKPRHRRARMEDSLTVGRVVKVFIEHNDHEHMIRALFGVKKSDLWVEATVANLDFITAAMTSDHNNGKFASTRPRGAFFRMNDEEEGDEGQDERRDDDGDERDGSADN